MKIKFGVSQNGWMYKSVMVLTYEQISQGKAILVSFFL